jgi:hypothetical protein
VLYLVHKSVVLGVLEKIAYALGLSSIFIGPHVQKMPPLCDAGT